MQGLPIMHMPSYPDDPHPGLPIPMWALLFALVLSVVATLLLMHQG